MRSAGTNPDWANIGILVLTLAGLIFGLLVGFLLLGLALFVGASGDTQGGLTLETAAVGAIVMALGGLPAAYWSRQALVSHVPPQPRRPSVAWAATAVLFPVAIGLGYLASSGLPLPGLFAPMAQVLAAGVPVGLVVLRIRRLAPPITPRRSWGQFLLGFWLAPVVALPAELLVLVPVALLWGMGLWLLPDIRPILEALGRSPSPPPDVLVGYVNELLVHPWTILSALSYMSVLVPLIEEAIKTVGVWPLLRRRLTAAEAFLGGVLCGAGYALFEALFLPQPGSDWALTMVIRVGATLMHAFTAGVTAWALAEAVVRRRPWRLVLAYLGSASIHGLWNAAALGIGFAGLAVENGKAGVGEGAAALPVAIGVAVIAALSGLALVGIPWIGARLNRADFGAEAQPPSSAGPEPLQLD